MRDEASRAGRSVQALDYRTPGVGPTQVQAVLGELAGAHLQTGGGMLLKLLAGGALCFVGPLIATGLLRGILRPWGTDVAGGFVGAFALVCVVVIPLLFWYEHRTRGQFDEHALDGVSRPASYGEFQLLGVRLYWTFAMSFALLGPRLVLEGLRGRDRLDAIDSHTRLAAAHVAVALLEAGGGIQVDELPPALAPADRARAIRHLLAVEWIDISSKRDRIWLGSERQDRLERLTRSGGGERSN